MSNMEVEDTNDQLVTIYFDDDDVNDQFNKSYLIEHSDYFSIMFNGNFIESQTGYQTYLKGISHASFVGVINSLKQNNVVFEDLKELLLILETSLLLQFSFISFESLKIIKDRYLYTINVVDVFSVLSKLGLKTLSEKAYDYILYNFQNILIQKRDKLLGLDEDDLQSLLKNNNLNVDEEIDVYNLIIDWCSTNCNYNNEYEMIVGCVHFVSMTNEQLQYCISKTNNVDLLSIMNEYITCSNEQNETRLLKSIRFVPYGLCAIKNEIGGQAVIYKWDWNCMQFTKFLELKPLPLGTNGYNIITKDFDIYVLAGEIGYGRGMWNKEGWKYNLLSGKWKKLEKFTASKRRHGIGYFFGDNFYLIGGLTKHRLESEIVEKFRLDPNTGALVRNDWSKCLTSENKILKGNYSYFDYNDNLVMITKDDKPKWLQLLHTQTEYSRHFHWKSHFIDLNATVICATCHRGTVYILTKNKENTIVLYSYCPTSGVCQQLKKFNTVYQSNSTMCAFNVNKVLVFGHCVMEHYFLDDDVFIEYKTTVNSFHFNDFISVPAY